jgi:hypothetical protein
MSGPAVSPAAAAPPVTPGKNGNNPLRLPAEATRTVRRMHLLDVTMLYAPQSGGVVRYLRAKHGWLRRNTSIRHSLLVPGASDARGANGEIFLRTRTRTLNGHRWPVGVNRWSHEILRLAPDMIEVEEARHKTRGVD